jgi:hypothetical protein
MLGRGKGRLKLLPDRIADYFSHLGFAHPKLSITNFCLRTENS